MKTLCVCVVFFHGDCKKTCTTLFIGGDASGIIPSRMNPQIDLIAILENIATLKVWTKTIGRLLWLALQKTLGGCCWGYLQMTKDLAMVGYKANINQLKDHWKVFGSRYLFGWGGNDSTNGWRFGLEVLWFYFFWGVKEVLYYGKLDKSHNRADVFFHWWF